MGYLETFLCLSLLVIIHELGHFLLARLFGVKVLRFSLGFGPVLLSKQFRGTEYALSAVPLGGYVKMLGELGGEASDDPQSYDVKPKWQRFLILVAGPVFNLVLGFLIILFCFSFFGIPVLSNKIMAIAENSPAAVSGIKPGDKIVEINGNKISSWDEVVSNITLDKSGEELELRVEREDSSLIDIRVRPSLTSGRPQIGIANSGDIVMAKISEDIPSQSLRYSIDRIEDMVYGLQGLISGETGARRALAGPIGIVAITTKAQSDSGLVGLLLLMAGISFNLGIFNLLPIPILDGGHIAILLVEAIIRRPLKRELKEKLLAIGFAAIIGLMIFATSNDLDRLFGK